MQGIELSKKRYEKYYRDIIPESFRPFLSVGLVGNGSECFGFDDEVSKDHDFDSGFCVWVDDDIYEQAKASLEAAYSSMPVETPDDRILASGIGTEKRKGIFRTADFYRGLIGLDRAPENPLEWLKIPDYALASATNGVLFTDNATDFTYIRNTLINGVPQDVFLKKLSSSVLLMAQAGQYNYTRCLRHGEPAAARLALHEFVLSAASCIFYLNRRFPPYYKWLLRGVRALPVLGTLGEKLAFLLLTVNYAECTDTVEEICSLVLTELKRRGLTEGREQYLEPHAYRIFRKISDQAVSRLHILS